MQRDQNINYQKRTSAGVEEVEEQVDGVVLLQKHAKLEI
jgi:hypothetical protein